MYNPPHFEESRIEVLHQLMRAHPLAALVTLSSDGLNANHIPLHLAPQVGSLGILRGHVARANPVWQDLAEGVDVLAIFQGPQAYVTPSWYPTKQEHGKVVPTWNYTVVHAHARLRVKDDPAWVREQIEALTHQQEAAMPAPWAVADAPADYVARLANGIVGIELEITRLTGKWKVSQNQPAQNQAGVARGLRSLGEEAAAALVEEYAHNGKGKPA